MDNEFKGEYFIETLQLLDDSNDGELMELSNALRRVQKQWSNILQQSFETETELMRHFAEIEITENDINNIKQLHHALPRIKQIVIDCGKMAHYRDKEKLDDAMNGCNSYFTFKSQKEMKEIIENYNYNKSIDEIARFGLVLQCTVNHKLVEYSCDDIDNMIDVILLCKTNNIESYVHKLNICKEISGLRVQYMMKGGRIKHQNIEKYQKIKATLKEHSLEEIRDEWKHTMEQWTALVQRRRIGETELVFGHIFNYFTINTIRVIIDKLNKYKRIKTDASSINIPCICGGVMCEGLIDGSTPKCGNVSCTNMSAIDSKPGYYCPMICCGFFYCNDCAIVASHQAVVRLFEEILCHFRYMKPEITKTELLQHIQQWQYIDSEYDKAFDCLNECFNTNSIVNKYKIEYNDISVYINYGVPNLMIQKNKKDAILSSLKLCIKNENNIKIPPYQYLICNETTLAEEIDIFINRCLQNRYRHHSFNGYPLYCLMFPEDLNFSVLETVTVLFTKRLMTRQKAKRYALIVISCNENNPLSNLLQLYNIKTSTHFGHGKRLSESVVSKSSQYKPKLSKRSASQSTTFFIDPKKDNIDRFTVSDGEKICNVLFNNSDNILKSDKLFVKLYKSNTFGAGKSFMIKQRAKEINEANIIRIPFNGPNIDLDFVVDRLYKCYDGQKRKKIIYHIDISSSASDTVNCVLFNILFLKYISTPKNRCFSITNNMSFLIEIPTALSLLKSSNRSIKNEFYLLHRPMKFNEEIVNKKTNPFQYDEHTRYAAKYLEYFYSNKLRTEDPDPEMDEHKISDPQIHDLVQKHFPNLLTSSKIHEKSFWEYLYCQFRQVVSSHLLRNEFYGNQNRSKLGKLFIKGTFSEWKHVTTESVVDLAQDFATNTYDAKQEEKCMQNNFHLTQKWQNADKEIVLLNQSIDGSISFLVSDKNTMDKSRKEALEKFKFDLLCWKQLQNNPKSKREKLKLLLKIIGNPLNEQLFKGKDIEYNSKHKVWIKGKITERRKQEIHIKLEDDRHKIVEEKHYKDKMRAYCALFSESPYCDYALTYDNMLKMIAIFFRVKSNIPVILMGETGCGKTFLLDYLAKAANIEIKTVNVHGGFTAKDIREKMIEWIKRAKIKLENRHKKLVEMIKESQPSLESDNKNDDSFCLISHKDIVRDIIRRHELQNNDDLWIFFDEINTSSDIGYFKEILCDKSFDGEPLPINMKIIGACNPYRLRNLDDIKDKSIVNDPLARYMYRVYPLPQTMRLYVWLFGSLRKFEKQYIIQMTQSMNQKLNKNLKQQQIKKLILSIIKSQNILRGLLKDSAYVSLRDVARCLKIFKWEFNRMGGNFSYSLWKALAITYYYRLNEQKRLIYVSELIKSIDISLKSVSKQFYNDFEDLFKTSKPKGIAWNQTLKENLFLLLTCIQTKIPVILVGKPGSSKSLAMSIMRDFLSPTTTSNQTILGKHNLKPIHILSFQCSAQSKAEDILKKWKQTEALAKENQDTIYVLLLDEIGLAEHSKKNRPLKVLHELLEIEPEPIAFVGLSNWQLDAAKMNRVVMHQCYIHKRNDLMDTAHAMAEQFYDTVSINRIESRFQALCGIYCDLMDTTNGLQPRSDFFGARDFYGVIRHFLSGNAPESTNEQIIVHFLRSFGGIHYKHQNKAKQKSFNDIMKNNLSMESTKDIEDLIRDFNPATLVALNLGDKRLNDIGKENVFSCDNFSLSRHVMIINDFINSWNVLLDLNILTYDDVFIFGSQFERDSSNIYLYLNHVKNCMETGQTLVLINLDEIHESLYDMLNQRYIFRKTDNKMYCRIALGSNSQTCFVDPSFKCIVIMPKAAAHCDNGTPIAFLNRFEKQLVSYHSTLCPEKFRLLYQLRFKLLSIYQCDEVDFTNIFPGYCRDTLPSIIINIWNHFDRYREHNVFDINFKKDSKILIDECIKILFELNSTESLIRAVSREHFFEQFGDVSIGKISTLKCIIEAADTHIYNQRTLHNPTDDPTDDDSDDDTDEKAIEESNHRLITFRDTVDVEYGLNSFCEWCQREEYDSDAIHQDTKDADTFSNIYHCFKTNYKLIKRKMFEYDEKDKSHLIVVLTYDFEFNLDRNAAYLHTTKIKSIEEFGKVDYFKQYIDNFLRADTEFNNLLLHYKHREDRKNHFIHIKHIILSLINKYQNNIYINKQIILMIHLQRTDDLYTQFPLIYCNSYKLLYLDSLSQQIPIDLNAFVKQTVSDICHQRGIQLLRTVFPRAISYLNFNNINDIYIEREIQKFSLILTSNRVIRQCIFKRFIELLCNRKINKNISEIVCNVIQESPNWAKGSFYERLNDTIHKFSACAMSHILKLLYTNNNINTISNHNSEIIAVFIALYQNYDVIQDIQIDEDIQQILERKRSLQIMCKYHAKFPFSTILSEWINSKKSLIVEDELEDDLYEDDEDNEDLYEKQRNEGGIPSNIKQLFNQYQVIINNEVDKLRLGTLSYHVLELYANDMIYIYAQQLNIDHSTLKMVLTLSAKLLIVITSITKDSELITIGDLECSMWIHTDFLIYIVCVLSILDEGNLNEIDIKYNEGMNGLMQNIEVLLEYVYRCLNENEEKYHLYTSLSMESAILYIVHFIEINFKYDCKSLYTSLNCIKIQLIASKHNLKRIEDDLSEIMENESLLLNYDALSTCLTLLTSLIPDNIKNNKKRNNVLCNKVLNDLLKLVDNDYISKGCTESQKSNFYEFLVDLLCVPNNIIKSERMTIISSMRYEILIKLFDLFSNTAIKIDEIVDKMQRKNDQFANVIIEIMSSKSRKYIIDVDSVHFVDSTMFHCTYSIQTPLIPSIDKELYQNCINAITLQSFFKFIQSTNVNKRKYPLLYRLSLEKGAFWYIQTLPHFLKWISLVHSKYSSTLSQNTCNELSIDDVLNAAKYNKWGDYKQWSQEWQTFRKHSAELKQPDITSSSSIYSSLIGNGNKTLESNRNIVETLIKAHNEFLISRPYIILDLFDIKSHHLVESVHWLNIIIKNAKLWICYDTHYEKESKTYIIFDLNRIQNEIYNVSIAGKNRLNVKMRNFEFVGSNNILRLIQQLKNQQTLSYEIWHLFDNQFETNIQRKRALNVIEDVISLLISAQNHNESDYNQILWQFMETNLFYVVSNEYLYFKFDAIKIKHLQFLWNNLVQRIEDKMKQYSNECIFCLQAISMSTPIKLECCGLNLHYNCLKKYINNNFIRNNGKKVTLKQLSCAICRERMRNKQIKQLFNPINDLYDKVTKIAMARLVHDKRENDEEIVNNDRIGYAMKLYSIFVCFKCKNPYYGGMNNCFEDIETDDDNDFAEQRLCNRCLPITMNPKKCPVHGDEYILWKCRFCCSYAIFFCWGTHHFCSMCHWKAYTLKNKPINKLVQCPCKPNTNTKLPEPINGHCPLGKHPQSGKEYCLGCALCQKIC